MEIIDIDDFDKTITNIKRIIENQKHYQEHLKYLNEARVKYLNELQFFPMVVNFIKGCETKKRKKITIILRGERVRVSISSKIFIFIKNKIRQNFPRATKIIKFFLNRGNIE